MIEEERPAMTVWKWYEARVGWMRVVIALAVAAVVLAFIWGTISSLTDEDEDEDDEATEDEGAPARASKSKKSKRSKRTAGGTD
jgi:flagellar biosynthesis/type III secretory pathway M-ring protein FliF/YscJ